MSMIELTSNGLGFKEVVSLCFENIFGDCLRYDSLLVLEDELCSLQVVLLLDVQQVMSHTTSDIDNNDIVSARALEQLFGGKYLGPWSQGARPSNHAVAEALLLFGPISPVVEECLACVESPILKATESIVSRF